ncbi:MAG TPA: sialidase family protein [Bacteroidales bacterium]|nr:sialidase family protein [Bacteroidales bacterium]
MNRKKMSGSLIVGLLMILAVTMLSACHKTNKHTLVELKQYQVPVLKYRQNNPVLQIRLTIPADAPSQKVISFSINTDGTDSLSDIKAVRVFYMGKDSLWIKYEKAADKAGGIVDPVYTDDFIPGPAHYADQDIIDDWRPVQFGNDMAPASAITIAGEQELIPGDNYFWVMYELTDEANLHHKVDGACKKIGFADGSSIKPVSSDEVVQRIGVALRQHLDNNVHTYRVPGLATTNNGTLLAIYDARRDRWPGTFNTDLQGNIDIGVSRSTDGGNTWEPMRVALDMGEWGGLPQKYNGVSDACILVDKNTGDIFVAGLWMHGVLDTAGRWIEGLIQGSDAWEHQWRRKGSQPGLGIKQTSQFIVSKSTDDGQTWQEPVNLTEMCKDKKWWLWAPAPGRGITMEDGTLVFPSQGRDQNGRAFSNITYSQDGGDSWKSSNPAFSGTNECAVVQLSDGSLMLNMRYRQPEAGKTGRAVSITKDLGETWTEHPTSRNTLPEPVCMGSLYKHVYTLDGEKKSVLLFSNPNISENPRRRTTIKVSFDEGMTWPEKYWLLLDEGYNRGYSCLTSVDENTIGIIYEGSTSDMTFESIPLTELIGK